VKQNNGFLRRILIECSQLINIQWVIWIIHFGEKNADYTNYEFMKHEGTRWGLINRVGFKYWKQKEEWTEPCASTINWITSADSSLTGKAGVLLNYTTAGYANPR
jgi:hypothetical protein